MWQQFFDTLRKLFKALEDFQADREKNKLMHKQIEGLAQAVQQLYDRFDRLEERERHEREKLELRLQLERERERNEREQFKLRLEIERLRPQRSLPPADTKDEAEPANNDQEDE